MPQLSSLMGMLTAIQARKAQVVADYDRLLQQQARGQPYAADPQTEAYLAQAVARHRAAHELVEELNRLVAYCKSTLD